MTQRFSKMPVQALSDSRLSLRDLRVLGALYAFDNGTNRCWPSRDELAEMTGLRATRISESTTRLESFGWIKKEGKGGRSSACRYLLTVPESGTVTAETVPDMGTVSPQETIPESGTVSELNGPRFGSKRSPVQVKTVPESGTGKEQTITDHNRPIKNKGATQETVSLPEWLDEKSWADYLDHRKAIKKPMTSRAQTLAIEKLTEFRAKGHDPLSVIRESITNGWVGLFEPKGHPQSTQRAPQRSGFSDIDYEAEARAAGWKLGA